MRKGNDMLFEFGPYKANINISKTKLFYETHGLAAGGCDCDGCRNFAKAVDALPLPVRSFFTQLGIDIQKPCECYVHYTNEDGTLLYGGFYHVCGTLLNKEGKKRESICQVQQFQSDSKNASNPAAPSASVIVNRKTPGSFSSPSDKITTFFPSWQACLSCASA